MATKVTILGEQPIEQEKKKIEFVYIIDIVGLSFIEAIMQANDYTNIELIRKNDKSNCYDVMFAYNEDRNKGAIYLGHFNDGIV